MYLNRITIRVIHIFVGLIATILSPTSYGAIVVTADYRPRPPEMIVFDDAEISGPIKDIFEKIVTDAGGQVKWRIMPFKRSLHEARNSDKPDFIVRMSFNKKRSAYLLPILFGYRKMDVYFGVNKGDEGLIKNYDDLYSHNIFVKSGSNYFTKFDQDSKLKRTGVLDDAMLARMFVAGRIRVMPVIDMESFLVEYRKATTGDHVVNKLAFADYVHRQNRARYITLSLNSIYAKNHEQNDSFYQEILRSTYTNRGCLLVDGKHTYDASKDFIRSAYTKYGLESMSPEHIDCSHYVYSES